MVARGSSDNTGPAAASPAAAVVGYSWRLVRVVGPNGALTVPPGFRATLDFQPGGHLQGDDSVNALGSTYRLDPHGFHLVGDSTSTLVGSLPGDVVRDTVVAAIDAVFYQRGSTHPEIPASVQGTVLTVDARGYTLTLQRGHAVTDDAPPSPTTAPVTVGGITSGAPPSSSTRSR